MIIGFASDARTPVIFVIAFTNNITFIAMTTMCFDCLVNELAVASLPSGCCIVKGIDLGWLGVGMARRDGAK